MVSEVNESDEVSASNPNRELFGTCCKMIGGKYFVELVEVAPGATVIKKKNPVGGICLLFLV